MCQRRCSAAGVAHIVATKLVARHRHGALALEADDVVVREGLHTLLHSAHVLAQAPAERLEVGLHRHRAVRVWRRRAQLRYVELPLDVRRQLACTHARAHHVRMLRILPVCCGRGGCAGRRTVEVCEERGIAVRNREGA